MEQEGVVFVVIIDPRMIAELKRITAQKSSIQETVDSIREACEMLFGYLAAFTEMLTEKIDEIITELIDLEPILPSIKQPPRNGRSISSLTRRIGQVNWYTTGFQ